MPSSSGLTPAIELPNRALDVYEVAESSTVCPATVRREANRGRLRGTKVGSRWRFQPDDVAAYLDGETPASAAERAAWDAYVRKVVAAAPPLTPEQIAALSALFDWQPGERCGVMPTLYRAYDAGDRLLFYVGITAQEPSVRLAPHGPSSWTAHAVRFTYGRNTATVKRRRPQSAPRSVTKTPVSISLAARTNTVQTSCEAAYFSESRLGEVARMECWFVNRTMASGRPSANAWAVIQDGMNAMLISPAVKRRAGIELQPVVDEDENAAVSMISRYRQSLKPV